MNRGSSARSIPFSGKFVRGEQFESITDEKGGDVVLQCYTLPRDGDSQMKKSLKDPYLRIEEIRLVSDLRIMHAKVNELFQVVQTLKRRHAEIAIRRYADHAALEEDIKRVDEIYLWFVGMKEERLKLTKK
jgi:hypothetical protein